MTAEGVGGQPADKRIAVAQPLPRHPEKRVGRSRLLTDHTHRVHQHKPRGVAGSIPAQY